MFYYWKANDVSVHFRMDNVSPKFSDSRNCFCNFVTHITCSNSCASSLLIINYVLPFSSFYANREKLTREIWSNGFFADRSLKPTILVKCRWELGKKQLKDELKRLDFTWKCLKDCGNVDFSYPSKKCWWWNQKKSVHILWNEPTLTLAASRKTGLLWGFWEFAHSFQVLTLLHHFYRTLKFLRDSMLECVVKKYTCLQKIDL